MFITRKKMKKKITDTYNKGFHIGKLYGVTKIYNEINELEKNYHIIKEVFNT